METTFRGACLCGAVRYEIAGEPTRFYHCHCGRCRKASGTGHATNLVVVPVSAHWSGEDLIGSFKVPEAERFTNRFCTRCGSPVPRVVPQLGAVVIPAGSLDSDIPIEPEAHIFWNSRAGWSGGDQELPRYPESAPPSE